MKKEITQYSFMFPTATFLFNTKKERNENKGNVIKVLRRYGYKGKLTTCEVRYKWDEEIK